MCPKGKLSWKGYGDPQQTGLVVKAEGYMVGTDRVFDLLHRAVGLRDSYRACRRGQIALPDFSGEVNRVPVGKIICGHHQDLWV